jgi:hypothetical protein
VNLQWFRNEKELEDGYVVQLPTGPPRWGRTPSRYCTGPVPNMMYNLLNNFVLMRWWASLALYQKFHHHERHFENSIHNARLP